MIYQFPVISNISDVLPYVNDNFRVVVKDDYTVINYHTTFEDTFPPLSVGHKAFIKRELRGIIFDNKTGKILRRPFHKFFNLNEREETSITSINWDRRYRALEKRDGSMITPIPLESGIRWGTKMGITDISMEVEKFVEENLKYREFAEYICAYNCTPIFEWCSPSNRIVLEYNHPSLTLLAIRENVSGKYLPYEEIKCYQYTEMKIPVVESLTTGPLHIEDYTNFLRNQENTEGVVIRFDDGHMIKVKTEWYCGIHRVLDSFVGEHRILELIVNDTVDDVVSVIPDDRAEKLKRFAKAYHENFQKVKKSIIKDMSTVRQRNVDRKQFALQYADLYPKIMRSVFFKIWDSQDLEADTEKEMKRLVASNISCGKSVDKVRCLWNDLHWGDFVNK